MATSPIERGIVRTGSRASSARFDTVSIPVYAIIATGIDSRRLFQVGATPQWTFADSVDALKTSTKPSSTSSSCVAKSMTARMMLSRADSWMPTMFSATSSTITTAPPTMSHGFSRSGSQNTER